MKRRFHLHLPGLLFVVLTISVGFAAANRPNNLVVWIFGAMLSLILVSGIISGSMMVRMRVSRLETRRAVVGSPLELRYLVANTSRFRSAFALRVDELIPARVRRGFLSRIAHGWSIRIAPGEKQVCDLVLWPRKRGVMTLERVRLMSFFPFGLVGRSLEFRLPVRILVHPEIRPVRRALLREAALGEVGGIRLARRPGAGEDFYSVREFRPGDSIRQVAWKRLGSSDELLVVQRSSSAPPRIRVLLDLSQPPDRLRFDAARGVDAAGLEERAIMMAASVLVAADREGHEHGLTILGFEDRPIPMRRGYWHRERSLSTLAEIDLSRDRTTVSVDTLSGEERAAFIVIQPGRIDTRNSPPRAWHWSATRIEDLLDLEDEPESIATESARPSPVPEVST